MVNYSDNGSFSQSSSSLYGSSLGFGPISNTSSNNFAPVTFGGDINPVTSSTGGLIFGGKSDVVCGASSLRTSSMSTSTLTFGATSPTIRSSFSSCASSPSSSSFGISFPAFSESNASNQNSQKAFQQTPVAPVDSAANSSNESAPGAVLCGNCCARRSQLISSAMSLPRGASTVGYIDATNVTSNSGFSLSTAAASTVSGTSSYGLSNTSIAGYSCPLQSFCQSASSFSDSTLPGNTSFGLQSTATQSAKNSAATAFGFPHGRSQVAPYTVTLDKDEINGTVFPSALISISAMPVFKDKSHEELRSEYRQGLCSKPVGIWNQFTSEKPTCSNRGTQWCSNSPSFSSKLGESRTAGFIASSEGGISGKLGEIKTSGFSTIPGGIELEKINSICSIPIYSSKSHEELRLEHHKSGASKPVNQFAVARNSFVNPLCLSTHSNLLTPQEQDSSETSLIRFPHSDASAKTSNFINSGLPSFAAPFTTGSSTVSQNSFSFFSPSPSVPQSQTFSFPPIAASTIESNFTDSGIKSSANSSSIESSSVCPNSFSFFTPSSSSVPQMLPFSFPVAKSASTSNFANYVVPSANPFSTVSSTTCPNPFSFFSPSSQSVPRSQFFSFPPNGTDATESNFSNSRVTSSANSFQTVSSSVCPVSFSLFCPSSPSVPQTLPFSFPITVTSASTSNFTNSEIPSFANPFSTISSTMCPNSFSFFNPSSPSVPRTEPFSFPGTEASISASNITSAGVPSSAKSFPPFEYSLPWKCTSYCEPAGPFTQPNISGEASTKGGFFNLFTSTQSYADNAAKCSQRKASFVASPPTPTPDFGDAASAGIFNQQSAGLRDSKMASQSCYQSINEQESVSTGAEVDLSSTSSSPFSVHVQYGNSSIHVSADAANESSEREGPSIRVYMNSETSHNRVGESLAVRPLLKTNGVNSDINPRFCVTITSQRKGEVSVVFGVNHDITKIMPKIQSADYYTIPPIEELAAREKDEPGFCGHVKDFVVGRRGYGSIKFLGETDVRELDLEALVKFNYREVIVFMDESKKPPIGQGLNKAAEITLLSVKCINKYTGIPYIDGPPVKAYREMLKDKVAELHGEMVSYDPALGEWKFKVQHF